MKLGDKTNDFGQRAGDCLDFSNYGKYGNCQNYPDWQENIHDCVICHNLYCENFDDGTGKQCKPINLKYVIKNCPFYEEDYQIQGMPVSGIFRVCHNSPAELDCKDIKDCLLKKIFERCLTVVNANHCNSCDGCGYDSGCAFKDCGTYQAVEIMNMLEIKEIK